MLDLSLWGRVGGVLELVFLEDAFRTPVRSGTSRWRVPGGRRHVDAHYDASCTTPAGGCTTAASILVEVPVGDGAPRQ